MTDFLDAIIELTETNDLRACQSLGLRLAAWELHGTATMVPVV
jgi:hypothetical protein